MFEVSVACACDEDGTASVTFARAACPACLGAACDTYETERTESCDQACPTWTAWDEGTCLVADRATTGTRTKTRECKIGDTLVPNSCPGDAEEAIDCQPWAYVDQECHCDGQDGTRGFICAEGFGLAADDVCAPKANATCNDHCGVWGVWSDWSDYFPACVDNSRDTLFNDLEKHTPERYRERDCMIKDATDGTLSVVVDITNQKGCPWEEKTENELQSPIVYCESNFNNEDDSLFETKVIVDFKLSLYEEWDADLNDQESQKFQELAEKYEHGLQKKMVDIASVDEEAKYKFATIRVLKFELETEKDGGLKNVFFYKRHICQPF